MDRLLHISNYDVSTMTIFSEATEVKIDEFVATIELYKIVQLPKLSASDMSYLQEQLTILYPEVAWFEPNTTAYIITQNLFIDLLEIGVTPQELRDACKRFKRMKTYGNHFKYQDFMQCVEDSRYRLYSYDELKKIRLKDYEKYAENSVRYYPKAGKLLTKKPVEMFSIRGLPLPLANEYNTIYKVQSKKNNRFYEVVGLDGLLEYEAIMTTRNHIGYWRNPILYFERTAEKAPIDYKELEELARSNKWYSEYLKLSKK